MSYIWLNGFYLEFSNVYTTKCVDKNHRKNTTKEIIEKICVFLYSIPWIIIQWANWNQLDDQKLVIENEFDWWLQWIHSICIIIN